MIYFFRWLFGYVEFSFKKGFVEDFLSQCFQEGIELRNVSRKEDYIVAYCNLKNYKRLRPVARKNGGVTRVIRKKGLPFLLLPLKNRVGFFVGIVCFCAIISFLNAFIWNVEIVGNDRVSDTAINAYLESNNLKKGTMWSSVDRKELSWNMLGDFEDFSWVHINKMGTTARVEVNESRQMPIADNDKLEGRDIFRKELTVTVSREQASIRVKEIKNYYTLNFFNANIPLYFGKKEGDTSEKSSGSLVIKDTKLPIGYTKYEEKFLFSEPRSLDDNELKALTKKRMGYKEKEELDGFEIVNKSEKYYFDDTSCKAVFSYIIRRK